jgi:hypothetical protein
VGTLIENKEILQFDLFSITIGMRNHVLNYFFFYVWTRNFAASFFFGEAIVKRSHEKKLFRNSKPVGCISEGQETGAIEPAPENARKKFEGRGRLRWRYQSNHKF